MNTNEALELAKSATDPQGSAGVISKRRLQHPPRSTIPTCLLDQSLWFGPGYAPTNLLDTGTIKTGEGDVHMISLNTDHERPRSIQANTHMFPERSTDMTDAQFDYLRNRAFPRITYTPAATPEPMPTPSTGDIQSLVMADVAVRREAGIAKYGTCLQAHNGRDALMDAYQEALDLACYLKQALVERDGGTK